MKNFEIKKDGKQFHLEETPSEKFYIDIVNEATPCDGCVHIQNCGRQRKACLAFALYVNKGIVNWELPRKPSKLTYIRTMYMYDVTLSREINKKLSELPT